MQQQSLSLEVVAQRAVLKQDQGKRFLAFSLPLIVTLLAAVVLVAALVWRVQDFFQYSLYAIQYPYQIDFDEGINMHAAWMIAQGESPYKPLDPNYFVSAPYPPLFYTAAAVALRFTGLAFWTGRLMSFVATLGIGLLLGLMAAHASKRWPLGVLAGLFWLSFSPTYAWATLYKHDMIALFFTVAGLYVVQRFADRRAIYWAVPIFALAFYTKQTALIGPAVGGLYLLVQEVQKGGRFLSWATWRRAVFFGLACLGAIAVPFVLLDWWMDHNLYLHVFTFQMLPWTFRRLVKNLNKLWGDHAALILLDVMAVGYLARWRKAWFYPLYLLVSFAAIVVSNGYQGGNYNHLLDIFPPLVLLFTTLLGGLWEKHRQALPRVALAVAMLALLWQGLHLSEMRLLVLPKMAISEPKRWYGGIASPEEEAQMAKIYHLVESTPGPILSEDIGLLLLTGHAVEYDDPSTMAPLARSGIWDDSVLADKLERRYYDLILLEYDISDIDRALRWSQPTFDAMKRRYRLLYPDWLYIYEPRPGVGPE